MDYTVAIDDVPKGDKGSKRNMAESWMEAADQHGIPTAFIVRDGKVAWIGHPMAMDEALEKSLAKDFDIRGRRPSVPCGTQGTASGTEGLGIHHSGRAPSLVRAREGVLCYLRWSTQGREGHESAQ